MKKAIIYARVSADEQAKHGYSLRHQVVECRKRAEDMGYSIVGEFVEEGISGAVPFRERPQGKQCLTVLSSGTVQAFFVYETDRLSRDPVDLISTVGTLLKSRIRIFADGKEVTDDNDISLLIGGWKAKQERRDIARRSMEKRIQKVREGKIYGGGRPPYGYRFLYERISESRLRPVGLEIIEADAAIVRLVFDLYTRRMMPRQIARTLNERGIPPPGRVGGAKRPRGEVWSYYSVQHMIVNETYAGTWYYRKEGPRTDRLPSSPKYRPRENWIAVQVPEIVSRPIWELAQVVREQNKTLSRRNSKTLNLLKGRIKCGCGYRMQGHVRIYPSGKERREYRCPGRTRISPPTCKARHLDANLLEATVWAFLVEMFEDREKFAARLDEAAKRHENVIEPLRLERAALIAQMEKTKQRAKELGNGMSLVDKEGVVYETLAEQSRQIDSMYQDQKSRLAEIDAEIAAQPFTPEEKETLLQFRDDVALGIANPTDELKIETFWTLDVWVTVTGRTIRIKSHVGDAVYELDESGRSVSLVSS